MPDEEIHSQFVDQILEQTLTALSESPAFGEETLARLEELAGSSGVTNFKKVVEALSTEEGE